MTCKLFIDNDNSKCKSRSSLFEIKFLYILKSTILK